MKSPKQKLQNRFNASVAEIDHQEDWKHTAIGMSLLSHDRGSLQSQLPLIEKLIIELGDFQVISIIHEWL